VREHGTRARYIVDSCRCRACRAANSEYAYRCAHEGVDLVGATEARRHLAILSRHGIGRRQVAAITGLSPSTIEAVAAGRQRRVRSRTADLILGVGTDEHVASRASVDAGPTHERIAALRRAGLSRAAIARALDYRTESLQILGRRRITVRNAERVRVLAGLAARAGLLEPDPEAEADG
jgi:hypothetical protein